MNHLMNTAPINHKHELKEQCIECFESTYARLGEKFNCSLNQMLLFNARAKEILVKYKEYSSPEIQRELNSLFCQLMDNSDPFFDEKKRSNHIASELYKDWKPKVLRSQNPFDLALRLSVAGNIMDYGANRTFNITQTIAQVLEAEFSIDDSVQLKEEIRKANHILYLGDNAGEIVFDKLFIETMMHPNVTYVVRGNPILNDVTNADAVEVGMEKVADVISNGYDAPSTVLSKCSKRFLESYNNADLIISKGQGNLESLIDEQDPRIYFLLMAKCDVIAKRLNVAKGSFIVLKNKGL